MIELRYTRQGRRKVWQFRGASRNPRSFEGEGFASIPVEVMAGDCPFCTIGSDGPARSQRQRSETAWMMAPSSGKSYANFTFCQQAFLAAQAHHCCSLHLGTVIDLELAVLLSISKHNGFSLSPNVECILYIGDVHKWRQNFQGG